MARRALVSWSSGKDSAWALHLLRRAGDVEIAGLLTTVSEPQSRVAMHGVPCALLARQAEAVGLPLWQVPIPDPCPNSAYEAAMSQVVARARAEHIDAIAFGDLFLEDIRAYREARLAGSGIEALFPLWQLPTARLADDMIDAGLEAIVACVDTALAPRELCGQRWNRELLQGLPAGADPCGENGEFHSFVVAGPMLAHPIAVESGALIDEGRFVYASLRSSESGDSC